jgi:hypothetical protein
MQQQHEARQGARYSGRKHRVKHTEVCTGMQAGGRARGRRARRSGRCHTRRRGEELEAAAGHTCALPTRRQDTHSTPLERAVPGRAQEGMRRIAHRACDTRGCRAAVAVRLGNRGSRRRGFRLAARQGWVRGCSKPGVWRQPLARCSCSTGGGAQAGLVGVVTPCRAGRRRARPAAPLQAAGARTGSHGGVLRGRGQNVVQNRWKGGWGVGVRGHPCGIQQRVMAGAA